MFVWDRNRFFQIVAIGLALGVIFAIGLPTLIHINWRIANLFAIAIVLQVISLIVLGATLRSWMADENAKSNSKFVAIGLAIISISLAFMGIPWEKLPSAIAHYLTIIPLYIVVPLAICGRASIWGPRSALLTAPVIFLVSVCAIAVDQAASIVVQNGVVTALISWVGVSLIWWQAVSPPASIQTLERLEPMPLVAPQREILKQSASAGSSAPIVAKPMPPVSAPVASDAPPPLPTVTAQAAASPLAEKPSDPSSPLPDSPVVTSQTGQRIPWDGVERRGEAGLAMLTPVPGLKQHLEAALRAEFENVREMSERVGNVCDGYSKSGAYLEGLSIADGLVSSLPHDFDDRRAFVVEVQAMIKAWADSDSDEYGFIAAALGAIHRAARHAPEPWRPGRD